MTFKGISIFFQLLFYSMTKGFCSVRVCSVKCGLFYFKMYLPAELAGERAYNAPSPHTWIEDGQKNGIRKG